MIDRDIRRRLLTIIQILQIKNNWLDVKQIIYELKKRYTNWYEVERRSIYADLKALEDFGWIELRQGRNNTTYAKINSIDIDLRETVQPQQLQERTLPKAE